MINTQNDTKEFGEVFSRLLRGYFNGVIEFQKSYDRNKSELVSFIDTVGVMTCCGYDDKFIQHCIVKLDLKKIPKFNPTYKGRLKKLKTRYYLFDVKDYVYSSEHLAGLTMWDLDTTTYLIDKLIEENSK